MARLSKEDYKEAVGCLKRYNYNCINIINRRTDIMNVQSPSIDGMPKVPYNISDSVYNQYIQLQEDKELQKSLKECRAVMQAIYLVNDNIINGIFEEEYGKSNKRWQVINILHISERTYERKKNRLIYAVSNELKKIGGKLAEF